MKTVALEVRPLTPEHGPQLLALHRACPIEADFSFFFDRSPDFFAWPKAVFDGYTYVGGFRSGQLVASALVATLGDAASGAGTFAYAGDVRVLPAARGQGFLRDAVRWIADLLPPDRPCLCLVKRGNVTATRALAAIRIPGRTLTTLLPYRTVNVLLARPAPPPVRCQVRRARPEDLPHVTDLLSRAMRGATSAPPVVGDAFRADLDRLPGFAVDDIYLAFAGEELVGALGAWDAGVIRRPTVIRYSWQGHLARAGYALARATCAGAAALPGPGQAFRGVTVTRVTVPSRDPAVLHDLLAGVYRDRLGDGYHMIHVGFAGDDPLLTATRPFLRQTFGADVLVAASPAAGLPWRADTGPSIDLRWI